MLSVHVECIHTSDYSTMQSYSREECQVQWLFSFHINSEVETIIFQVLSTICRVF